MATAHGSDDSPCGVGMSKSEELDIFDLQIYEDESLIPDPHNLFLYDSHGNIESDVNDMLEFMTEKGFASAAGAHPTVTGYEIYVDVEYLVLNIGTSRPLQQSDTYNKSGTADGKGSPFATGVA